MFHSTDVPSLVHGQYTSSIIKLDVIFTRTKKVEHFGNFYSEIQANNRRKFHLNIYP